MTTSIDSRPTHHRQPLGLPLRQDWDALTRTRPELDDLVRAVGLTPVGCRPPGHDAVGDHRLGDLVRVAADDPVAARVVLQRLLPGLIAIARRRGRGCPRRTHECFDELVASGWIVIRSFPIERRPAYVAANLLRDIEYQTFTRAARRAMTRREVAVGIDDTMPAAPNRTTPFDEVVQVLAAGRSAGLDPADLAYAAALASGRTVEELAAERGVSARAERYRRTQVVARLRRVALGCVDEAAGC